MMVLGIIVGAIIALFVVAGAIGVTIGLAIGIVRFIRNPASLFTSIKTYFVSRPIKYGR